MLHFRADMLYVSNMSEYERLKREWELRFPSLNDDWTHWWLEGDGGLLAILDSSDLSAALDIVWKHHSQFLTIIVYVAKLDSFKEVVRYETRRWVITTHEQTFLDNNRKRKDRSELQCCFCGRIISEIPEPTILVRRLPTGEIQFLRYHDECLRSLLHHSLPV